MKLAYTQNVVELKKRKENRTTKRTKKQNLTQFTKRKKISAEDLQIGEF